MSAQFLDYCFGCVISFTVKAVDNVDGANGWHRSRFSRNDSLEFSEFSLDIDHFRPVHILDSFLPFFSFEMISIDYLIVEGVDRTLWNFETRLKFLNFFLFPFESIIEIFERSSWKKGIPRVKIRFLQSARTYLNSFLIIWTKLRVAWTNSQQEIMHFQRSFVARSRPCCKPQNLDWNSVVINLKWDFLAVTIPPCYSIQKITRSRSFEYARLRIFFPQLRIIIG